MKFDEIGTRQLGEKRWEAFYVQDGFETVWWPFAEGRFEEEAISNLKMRCHDIARA